MTFGWWQLIMYGANWLILKRTKIQDLTYFVSTGKSLSEALIFASINHDDNRLFMELPWILQAQDMTRAEHVLPMFCPCSALVVFMVIPWKSFVILWVRWCKNTCFRKRFTCTLDDLMLHKPAPFFIKWPKDNLWND